MSLLNKLKGNNQSIGNILKDILSELEKLNQKQDVKFYKEWYPLFFHFNSKGYQITDANYGASKWGFRKIENKDLKLDFDYEFHSLDLHTENRNYKPAIRLILNGSVYPNVQRIVSDEGSFDDWVEFEGHNYNYQRVYQFSDQESYQSNMGRAHYPFKMTIHRPWQLNFEFFQTSTSTYWHTLTINGWRLHPIEDKKVENIVSDLEKIVY